MSEREKGKNTVKSIEKALGILMLFSHGEKELSNTEIARRMGWNTATASRLLGTLLEGGFLVKNEENGKYMLGSVLYYLGQIAMENQSIYKVSRPVLEHINQLTDETAHVFIREGIHRICIDQVASEQMIKMSSTIGAREPLWEGCTGRTLLAWLPEEKREDLLAQLGALNPQLDLDGLRAKMQRARERGFSSRDGEWANHCGCVAAPIFDREGRVNACLAISTPDFRFPDDDSAYAQLVLEGAETIARKAGYGL